MQSIIRILLREKGYEETVHLLVEGVQRSVRGREATCSMTFTMDVLAGDLVSNTVWNCLIGDRVSDLEQMLRTFGALNVEAILLERGERDGRSFASIQWSATFAGRTYDLIRRIVIEVTAISDEQMPENAKPPDSS